MRYNRQILLPQVGLEGQRRLARSHALIVGVGGLGSPVALYLAAAGVGKLTLLDPDCVDESNLQRQILYETHQTGQLKVVQAAKKLHALNPDIEVRGLTESFSMQNALDLCQESDVVIDGSDNFATKFLINDVAVKTQKPWIYGSISRWEGQVSVFDATHGPCYRCLYPHPPKNQVLNCAEAGIMGGVAGTIGSLQAVEAIKVLLAPHPTTDLRPLYGKLWVLQLATGEIKNLRISKNPSCPVCSLRPDQIQLREETNMNSCFNRTRTDLTCEELQNSLADDQYALLDVRELEEWDDCRIETARHWPLSRLTQDQFPSFVEDTPQTWVIYCRSGRRSLSAQKILSEKFPHLQWLSLKEGITGWNGPVVRGRP